MQLYHDNNDKSLQIMSYLRRFVSAFIIQTRIRRIYRLLSLLALCNLMFHMP